MNAPEASITPQVFDEERRLGVWSKLASKTALLAAGLILTVTGAADSADFDKPIPESHSVVAPETQPTPDSTNHPNVVLILVDDLDWSLMPYMSKTNRLLGDDGAKLAVEDEQSLCCTARSTLLTGKYSHNTHVVGNTYPLGGYVAFHHNDEAHDLPVWLHRQGIFTRFMGKYLNQYPAPATNPGTGVADTYVPPGWDGFISPIGGHPYYQFSQELNVNGAVDKTMRHRFLGDALSDMAVRGLNSMPKDQPFFEEVSTYSPHNPYSYPHRLAGTFQNVRYPRTPAFDEADVYDKPWPLHNAPPLSVAQKQRIDEVFRDRVRAVQVIDDTVQRVIQTLKRNGTLDNTYVIFTSDNGYFEGEHRRDIGKYDQYQKSLSVPFYVRGPGIKPGTNLINHVLAGNIDIAPTIADMTNTKLGDNPDGESLLPILQDTETELPKRQYLLIGRGSIPTYRHAASGIEEPPDSRAVSRKGGLANDFLGVYSGKYKYIAFTNGYNTDHRREELYDEQRDPFELDNLLGPHDDEAGLSLRDQRILNQMRAALPRLLTCAGVSGDKGCDF